MLEDLKFVQGAVAKKDFVQALTHFRISNGYIMGYNGSLALQSPISLDLEVTPKALPFIKAIQTCRDTVQLSVTPAGRLSVKSGKFRAYVECTEEPFPDISPEGEIVPLNGGVLDAFRLLEPFIADDATRPWARGILFRGRSAFATNNVILIEHWLGYDFPVEVNIPHSAVAEILRIKKEPTSLQLCDNSVTFHFDGGRWLRTQIYTTQWPDLSRILERPATPMPLPPEFFSVLGDLRHFVGEMGKVFVNPGKLSTNLEEGLGASYVVDGLDATGVFRLENLLLLEGVITGIDLSLYPEPCIFEGPDIRGAIIGMRE